VANIKMDLPVKVRSCARTLVLW